MTSFFAFRSQIITLALGLAMAALPFIGPVSAQEVDVSLLVPWGRTAIDLALPAGALVTSVHGPSHGIVSPANGTYEPGESFWQMGSDSAILHVQVPGQPSQGLRYRWAVGEPSPEGIVVSMDDPGQGTWIPWKITDTPSNPIQIVPGTVEPLAWSLAFQSSGSPPPSLEGAIGGDDGDNESTTTTSDVTATIVDIENGVGGLGSGDTIVLHRILEDGLLISEVLIRWNDSAQTWEVALSSPIDGDPLQFTPFDITYNRLRVTRWTQHDQQTSGVDLEINDIVVSRLDASPRDPLSEETVEVTLDPQVNEDLDMMMTFEALVTRSGDDQVASGELLIRDGFTTLSPIWQPQANTSAMAFSTQQLPGPGQQIEIDLGQLAAGSTPGDRSSSLLTNLESLSDPLPLDPATYGFRFWIDPTLFSLPYQGLINVLIGNLPGTGIVLKGRIEQRPAGPIFEARARLEDGTWVSIATSPISSPRVIEILMRNGVTPGIANGWLELWADGALIGRITGLDNHGQQIERLHFGARTVPVGASGVLLLDDFEAWRVH